MSDWAASENSQAAGLFASLAAFVLRQRSFIVVASCAACVAGLYSVHRMPSAVFPQTDFPRIVILVDNGVMPATEMMATVTRTIEESMKDIPGAVNTRSATGRGSAEINLFFTWNTDMVQAELYVMGRLAQIRSALPATATCEVHRLTFSSFPIMGLSLTSATRDITELSQFAEFDLKPRLLRMEGVALVGIVGGRQPEYQVAVDPALLDARKLSLSQVSEAIAGSNAYVPAGLHEDNHQLYLAAVDGRAHGLESIGDISVAWANGGPVLVRDIATVERKPAPAYNIVTADGAPAVLLNIYSQTDGDTVGIAEALDAELQALMPQLPPGFTIASFYDQSLFVRQGARSVWESIGCGLLLSMLVLFLFLRNARTTLVAVLAIPVCLLMSIACLHAAGLSFNLMTLGGIAAAIGLVIDDAIVVVEAVHTRLDQGQELAGAVRTSLFEVGPALLGSTLTPVAVFLPLAYLNGVPGVFFRALAIAMASALAISLIIALTLIPCLCSLMLGSASPGSERRAGRERLLPGIVTGLYEQLVRHAIGRPYMAIFTAALPVLVCVLLFPRLGSDFLPSMDERAFVLDYVSPPGTSLTETDRMLHHVEDILRSTPGIESFSRRTGAQLGLAMTEPNTGDFLVKLNAGSLPATTEVIRAVRNAVRKAEPALELEFPGVLADLIGDLTWSSEPVEIKLFSPNMEALAALAPRIAETIGQIPGVVDVNDGLVVAGPSANLVVRRAEAARAGISSAEMGASLGSALLGTVCSSVLEADRIVPVRVRVASQQVETENQIAALPLLSAKGTRVSLFDLTDIRHEPGLLEIHREDQRQLVTVSARLSGVDLRSGIHAIQEAIGEKIQFPPDVQMEIGGLYQQQQDSFANLLRVLGMSVFLVFAILLMEFRSLRHPLAIVFGSLLSLSGVIMALFLTGTSLNIISFLGAIIGFGLVAKNGILMLDLVGQLEASGLALEDAVLQSGRRRLRPVLMTSLTAFLGLLPLACGIGAGADMLRPMAIGVMGALCISMLLSLAVTPAAYYLLTKRFHAAPFKGQEP